MRPVVGLRRGFDRYAVARSITFQDLENARLRARPDASDDELSAARTVSSKEGVFASCCVMVLAPRAEAASRPVDLDRSAAAQSAPRAERTRRLRRRTARFRVGRRSPTRRWTRRGFSPCRAPAPREATDAVVDGFGVASGRIVRQREVDVRSSQTPRGGISATRPMLPHRRQSSGSCRRGWSPTVRRS
jgi:hypothetical protein